MPKLANRPQAFSLLELTVSAALLAVIGSLLLISHRTPAAKAGVGALAGALAGELRQARQLAIASQVPVAIVFPGRDHNGASPYATSFYQLEGSTSPRRTRVVDFRGDFPGCVIFNGTWNTNSTQFRNSSAPVNQASPTIPGHKWASLDLDQWLPASARTDYCFVFCPDGTVRTNDLATFDSAYHLVVSKGGGGYRPAAAPSNTQLGTQPAYFTPTALGESQTLTVDLGGSISTSAGLACLASGTTVGGQISGGIPVSRRALAPLTAPAPSDPVVTIRPDTPDSAAGAQVSIGPDGFVSLEVTATDAADSGQRLYCRWFVQPVAGNTGSGNSDYSIPVSAGRGIAMNWDQTARSGRGAWHSLWQWRPPADGAPGDKYDLSVIVQDSTAAHVSAIIRRQIRVCPAGQVLYQYGAANFGNGALYKMNPDGGGKKRFHISPNDDSNPVACSEGWSSASIDGSRIAFLSARPDVAGGPYQVNNQVQVTDRGGNYGYRVSDPSQACEQASISPLGDLVAYRCGIGGGNMQICVVNTDPLAANRRIFVVETITGRDSMWYGAFTGPRRDWVMDQCSWDTHCDDPSRADTLYYTKQVGASPGPAAIYKVQIQRNAAGQPVGIRSGSTTTPVISGVLPYGARSPHFFSDLNGVDYLFHCLDDGDPSIGNFGTAAVLSGGLREEQPCPWMEGTDLRLFAVNANAGPPFTSTIVRLTPAATLSDPTDRIPLTPAGNQALFPVYLPPGTP